MKLAFSDLEIPRVSYKSFSKQDPRPSHRTISIVPVRLHCGTRNELWPDGASAALEEAGMLFVCSHFRAGPPQIADLLCAVDAGREGGAGRRLHVACLLPSSSRASAQRRSVVSKWMLGVRLVQSVALAEASRVSAECRSVVSKWMLGVRLV